VARVAIDMMTGYPTSSPDHFPVIFPVQRSNGNIHEPSPWLKKCVTCAALLALSGLAYLAYTELADQSPWVRWSVTVLCISPLATIKMGWDGMACIGHALGAAVGQSTMEASKRSGKRFLRDIALIVTIPLGALAGLPFPKHGQAFVVSQFRWANGHANVAELEQERADEATWTRNHGKLFTWINALFSIPRFGPPCYLPVDNLQNPIDADGQPKTTLQIIMSEIEHPVTLPTNGLTPTQNYAAFKRGKHALYFGALLALAATVIFYTDRVDGRIPLAIGGGGLLLLLGGGWRVWGTAPRRGPNTHLEAVRVGLDAEPALLRGVRQTDEQLVRIVDTGAAAWTDLHDRLGLESNTQLAQLITAGEGAALGSPAARNAYQAQVVGNGQRAQAVLLGRRAQEHVTAHASQIVLDAIGPLPSRAELLLLQLTAADLGAVPTVDEAIGELRRTDILPEHGPIKPILQVLASRALRETTVIQRRQILLNQWARIQLHWAT